MLKAILAGGVILGISARVALALSCAETSFAQDVANLMEQGSQFVVADGAATYKKTIKAAENLNPDPSLRVRKTAVYLYAFEGKRYGNDWGFEDWQTNLTVNSHCFWFNCEVATDLPFGTRIFLREKDQYVLNLGICGWGQPYELSRADDWLIRGLFAKENQGEINADHVRGWAEHEAIEDTIKKYEDSGIDPFK